MTDTPSSGSQRRDLLLTAMRASEHGWARTSDIADENGLDRSTLNYHATKMVELGLAATGDLRRIGHPGRPSRVVIDLDRLPDIPKVFPVKESAYHPETGTVTSLVDCTIENISTPDEYESGPRRAAGPITRALMSGADHDAIVRAVAHEVASALLQDLARGHIRLVIEPVADTTEESPS